jgi:hypothetical protein
MTDTRKTDPVPVAPDRNQLRATILKSRQAKRELVDFFGGQIEIKQPLLGDIIAAQNNDDREAAVIDTLIKYAVVPGTDERVFEDGDAETLKGQPFGKDFLAVTAAIGRLTDVDFLDKKPGSAKT